MRWGQKELLFLLLLALSGIAFMLFFTPGPVFKDEERVDFNQCVGRLISLRSAVMQYKKENDKYPETASDLAPDFVTSNYLYCPKSLRAGKAAPFVYRRPEDSNGNPELLFRSPTPNYKEKEKVSFVYVGINTDGKILTGSDPLSLQEKAK